MWNVKTNVIPVIIGATGTISKLVRIYMSNIPGNLKSRSYRKQPYWALHTYSGKYLCKSTIDSTLELAIYAP
jgi:hypothetical protein